MKSDRFIDKAFNRKKKNIELTTNSYHLGAVYNTSSTTYQSEAIAIVLFLGDEVLSKY